jgi:hypothetical protein
MVGRELRRRRLIDDFKSGSIADRGIRTNFRCSSQHQDIFLFENAMSTTQIANAAKPMMSDIARTPCER